MVNNFKYLIKTNLKSFISIMLLTMLGVGFFIGMKSSVPNLKYTIEKYFDDYNLYNIELSSSVGFTKDDIEKLSTIEEIEKIEGGVYKDFLIKGNHDDYVLRVHSYIDSNDSINKLELLEGELPKNINEIVIEQSLYKSQSYKIGDIINLKNNLLIGDSFKIVGVVKSPYYLSNNKGSTNLLSGRVNYYAYININSINTDIFSNVYIKINNSKNIDNVINKIKNVGKESFDIRYYDTINELKTKIQNGQNELDSKKTEVTNKINELEEEIKNAELQIISAEKSIPSLSEAQVILSNKKNELNKIKVELDNAKLQIDNARIEYNNAKSEYDKAVSQFNEIKNQIESYVVSDSEDEIYIEMLKNSINYYEIELNNNLQKLNASKSELDAKQYEYDLTYSEYQKALRLVEANSPEEIIASAKQEVEAKKNLLNQRKEELISEKQRIYNELENYQNELNDAKDYLKLISVSSWSINKRKDIPSYSAYLSDIKRIEQIGNFFPIIFYVVAVLITLTNVSRIIENERDTIGLYKALGYKDSKIINDYLIFSLISCLIGSLLGIIIGFYFIPKIFYNIYKIIYYLPNFRFLINYKIIFISITIAIVLILLSTYLSINKTIKEYPSALLRPKQNNKGTKVILEYITFIWKRLNFTSKVTFRNIFKYPKRFIMTIVGIAGCISLIVSGFNIKSSIANIIPLQFEKIFDVDAEIFLKDSLTRSETQKEKDRINNLEEIEASILSYIKYVKINGTEVKANLVIPEDNDLLLDFVTLKNGNSKVELSRDGALISKKIANKYNIKKGSTIKLTDSENNVFDIKISNIVDNYVDNYIYISKEYYNDLLGNFPKYNTILVRTKNDKYNEENLSVLFNETDNVSYLVYTSTSKIVYNNLMKSLNYIVLMLVISAVMLAFIVLYNLNTLNVSERKREIATIKVLGFYKKETYKYIENEIKLLTIIGIIIGIIFGYFISNILIHSCELDNLMYDYSINYYNYLYSIVITIVFMIITSIIGRRNILNIDMIESLKKVE